MSPRSVAALCGVFLLVVHTTVLVGTGTSSEAALALLQSTARTSVLFFLAAFVASALRRLGFRVIGTWLLQHRRTLGLSAAASHTVHLAAIVWVQQSTDLYRPDVVTLLFGGLAYVLLFGMAVTSTSMAQRRLGRRWRQLHLLGSWWLWFVFLATFAANAAERWTSAVASLALLAAFGLRVGAALQERSASTSVGADLTEAQGAQDSAAASAKTSD